MEFLCNVFYIVFIVHIQEQMLSNILFYLTHFDVDFVLHYKHYIMMHSS